MIIKELKLINHRNYENDHVIFHDNTNILVGKNAQGKTNLLEAIYMCARGYSFKSLKEEGLIQFGKDNSYLKANILNGSRKRQVEIKLSDKEKKRIRINEIEISNLKELKSQFGVVIFSPEELKIVKETPSIRRSFLDEIISNNDISYKSLLNDFQKVRGQRNDLLKKRHANKYFDAMIKASNDMMVDYGSKVAIYRYKYILMLNEYAKKFHKLLSSDKEELSLEYKTNFCEDFSNLDTIKENYRKKIEENKQREYDQYQSLYGPHKDDILISINGLDSRSYASQGQQRTAMLALRLGEAMLIEKLTGLKPILLLDDVFSELDNQRARLLVEAIKGYQTIITTNTLLNIDTTNMDGNVYRIEAGKIINQEAGERK